MSIITREILLKARTLIADPKHWTKGEMARTQSGRPTTTTSPTACQWCSVGAITKAAREVDPSYDTNACYGAMTGLRLVTREVMEKEGYQDDLRNNLAVFNDTHTHAEILSAFDKAIDASI